MALSVAAELVILLKVFWESSYKQNLGRDSGHKF